MQNLGDFLKKLRKFCKNLAFYLWYNYLGMEKDNKSILVVESDRVWQTRIRNHLKEKGFKIYSVDSAQAAIDFCIKNLVDIVLLELNLPDKDGIYVIQTIRTFNNTLPIIVVSSRNLIESKILALDAGANDYMVKPINLAELEARMRKEFRYLVNDEKHQFTNGNLTIDYDAKTIFINGVEVHFTNFEYKIIVLLAYNLGKTLTYDYIIDHIWGKGGQDQNGLRVFMAGIRKKANRDIKSSKLIRTDIGVGYRMNKIK